MNDPINPSHYQDTPPNSGIRGECIDYAERLGFAAGNAFKYAWRAGRKGDMRQDLEKAAWYLRRVQATRAFHGIAPLMVDGGIPQTPRRRILHLIAIANMYGAREAEKLIRHALDNPAALDALDKPLRGVA